MALVLKDRVKVLATTTGTGTFTLGSAVTGYQDFSVIGNGNTTYYTIAAQTTPDWEVGIGTYTAAGTLLSRDTILESSNGGTAVNFPAGTKDVFVTYPAERATYLDTAGAYPVQNTFNTLNAASAVLTAGTVSTTPTAATDIANKTYVDTVAAAGIHYHAPVRLESPDTVGNLNATYNQPGGAGVGVGATLTNAGTQAALVIDGVATVVNDRILIYNQTNAAHNGVYTVTNIGSVSTNWVMTRATDADTYAPSSPNSLGQGDAFFVSAGNTGAGETYVCNTVGVITFGTTAITFAQFSSAQVYSAGTGLTLTNTTFSLANTGTAGTYGSASQVPVFTTNAQGQVTTVTDTAIAIAAGAVSGLAPSATTDTTNASNITTGTLPTGRLTGSYTGVTGVGTLTAGTWNGSTVAAAYGGTGLSTFVAGDLIYADSSSTLARLADVAVGNALISGGASADPSWGKVGLATHVDGTLPIANGGTNGAATPTAGGVAYGNGTAYAFSSAGTSGQVLTSNGTGAPSWATLSSGTVTSVTGTLPISVATGTTTPVISISQAGTASNGFLSSTDWNTFNNKTNNTGTVTSVGGTGTVNGITLTGTVTTSGNLTLGGTLSGVSLTTQVSGTLPIANGGTNATSAADARTNLDVPTRTGGNASGTWGISVTGNAATATTATNVSGTVAIANGGTGATTAATALSNLNGLQNNISQQGGVSYLAQDFNSYPSVYNATFVNPTGSTNLPTGMSSVMSYRFIMGGGDTAGRGFDLVGAAESSGNLYMRERSLGTWSRILHSNNYTLYAPTLTGGGASGSWGISVTGSSASCTGNAATSSNTSSISNATGGSYTWTNQNYFVANRNTSSDSPALQAYSNNGSGAIMSFHRGGAYAINFGLDSDNVMRIGGWSAAANRWQLDMSGNCTVAGSMTAGYIYGSYFNSTAGNSENPTIGQFWTQSTGDNFVRKSTPSHVVSQLGLVSNYGTSYYQVNTWLQLNGGYGLYCPSINGAHLYPNNSSSYGEWATQGSRSGYSGNYSTYSGVNGSMYDSGGNGGVYRETSGRWYFYYHLGNDCMGIGTSGTDSGYSLYLSKGVRGFSTNYTTGVTYSATYYDVNDATYYVDPASTSVMKTINQNGSHNLTYAAPSGTWPQQVTGSVDRGTLYQATAGSSIPLYFNVNNGSTNSGYVICSGGSTSYVTSSDYRMKENVQDLDKDAALAKIMAVKPVTFNWLPIHGGEADVGFIAHILQETAPECVDGEKDRTHPDGKIFPQAIDRSMLVPSICAAMQKQQQLIEQLIAEVALLKGN